MWRHKADVKDAEIKETQMEAMWYIKTYILKSASWVYYENLKFQNFYVAFLFLLSVYYANRSPGCSVCHALAFWSPAISGSSPTRGEIFSTVNAVPFHFRPTIVLIWLKYCLIKDVKSQFIHPSYAASGPEVIKLFSCSTQLTMKFSLLIYVKMPTIVGILTFMSRKNSILGLSEPKNIWISWYFHIYEHLKFHAQVSWAWKKFYNLGPWSGSSLFAYVLFRCLKASVS